MKDRQEKNTGTIIASAVILVALAVIVLLFEIFGRTGFEGRSLWEWMELLIIPIVLSVAAYLFNRFENERERELAQKQRDQDLRIAEEQREQDLKIAQAERETDLKIAQERRNEDILQAYFDKMTTLMMDEDWLRPLDKALRIFDIARVRTISILRALEQDKKRQKSVIYFLRESNLLVDKEDHPLLTGAIMMGLSLDALDLSDACLEGVNLSDACLENTNLSRANLRGVDFSRAKLAYVELFESDLERATWTNINLQQAMLGRANLNGVQGSGGSMNNACAMNIQLYGAVLQYMDMQGVHFFEADLRKSFLFGCNFTQANLKGATLQEARLRGCDFTGAILEGGDFTKVSFAQTILPDGSKWSPNIEIERFTNVNHPEFWRPPNIGDYPFHRCRGG